MENNTENRKNIDTIDLREVMKKLLARKKLFYKTLPIAFVLSCIYIFSIPRNYTSETKLAPEMENPMSGGALGAVASSFGIDLGDMQTTDAITPLLYPDLMEDNKFVADMFAIKVVDEKGKINTTYYDYLNKYQKKTWWDAPVSWMKKLFKSTNIKAKSGDFNPYYMAKQQDDIAKAIRGNVSLNVDKKTSVITISTKAQDPLIAKVLADSVRVKLQAFITEYRTNKARNDEKYYKKLAMEAKAEYEKSRQLYGSYSDANTDAILESVRAKQTDLENEMQLKYNTYSTLMTQYQAARAKVQERTPAFTIIRGAAVPLKPSEPKRMIFVTVIIILTFFSTAAWILIKDLLGKG